MPTPFTGKSVSTATEKATIRNFDNHLGYNTEAQSNKHEAEAFANVSIAPYSAIIYSQD